MSVFDFDGEKGYTVEGLFGSKIHYDANGNCIGRSQPGIIPETYNHYGADGDYEGSSSAGLFSGSMNHYNEEGEYVGSSDVGLFADLNHYDASGYYVGSSFERLFDTKTILYDDEDV